MGDEIEQLKEHLRLAMAEVGGGGISPGSLPPPQAAVSKIMARSGNDNRFQNMMFTLRLQDFPPRRAIKRAWRASVSIVREL